MYRPYIVQVARGSNKHGLSEARLEVFDLATEIEPMVRLCTDQDAMMKASKAAMSLCADRSSIGAIAVYVIGPKDDVGIHKIGISNNPIKRLEGLQIGNWHPLAIKSLLWIYGYNGALKAEQLALAAAAEMDVSLGGEWVEMDALEASALALKAARYERLPACDSSTLLHNLAARMEAAAKTMRGMQKAA
jgi:hypothetical protein